MERHVAANTNAYVELTAHGVWENPPSFHSLERACPALKNHAYPRPQCGTHFHPQRL
jgi:hypothetical protein